MPFHLGVSGWLFRTFSGVLYPRWLRSVLEAVGWHLPEGGRVLDVGGGTGTMGAQVASRRGLPVWVVDPAMGMLRYAEESVRVRARGEALPFREDTFVCVMAGEALHHFRDVPGALREMVRVLHPEGVLLLYEFDPATPVGWGVRVLERLAGEPGNFFPPRDLARVVARVFPGARIRWVRRGFRYILIASHHPIGFLDEEEVEP